MSETSIWKIPGFTATMVAVGAAFSAFSLLLPVLPMHVLEDGGSATLAGAATGAFMGATVITQIFTPWLLRKLGYRPVIAFSAFMLGVPALGHILGTDAWIVVLFSMLRGVGFGGLTVAQFALIAELVPIRYLGKATGTMGLFIGLAQMVFLPVGLGMAQTFGFTYTYLIAGSTSLVALIMCMGIPALYPQTHEDSAPRNEAPRVPMWKLVLVPALGLSTITMSFGVINSFLPASIRDIDPGSGAVLGGIMLSLVGGAGMVFRYLSGVIADRIGQPGRLFIPSQIAAFVSMGLLAAAVANEWSVAWMIVAAIVFGGAFGAVQNESLLLMFSRLPRTQVSEASAIWNVFYDAGTGLGSVALAALVTGYGYAGAYAAGAFIIIAGVAMTSLDMLLGRYRVTEYNNIRTRLRRMRRL